MYVTPAIAGGINIDSVVTMNRASHSTKVCCSQLREELYGVLQGVLVFCEYFVLFHTSYNVKYSILHKVRTPKLHYNTGRLCNLGKKAKACVQCKNSLYKRKERTRKYKYYMTDCYKEPETLKLLNFVLFIYFMCRFYTV